MKTLVNKNNPAIRITAPEVEKVYDKYYYIIGIRLGLLQENWTLVEEEQQMPDSAQLIAEWEREKAVLEQKDFRGDAERMAYNAFLDGFVKGLGYEGTK